MNLQHMMNLEEVVIGSILTKDTAISAAVRHLLRPEMFSNPKLAVIYTTAEKMHKAGETIDILSFRETLARENLLEAAGGIGYLARLINDSPIETTVEKSIRLLKETHLKQKLITSLSSILTKTENETYSLKEALAETSLSIESIINDYLPTCSHRTMPAIMEQSIAQIEKRFTPDTLTGIPTGISQLDALTSGWHPGELILLAAAPSTGKTTVALHIAKAAARAGYHTVIYSPDMPGEQLADRFLLSEAPFLNDRKEVISEKEMEQAYNVARHLSELPLHIDDSANPDMEQIHSSVLIMQSKGKCNLIVIDSLQQCEADLVSQYPDRNHEIEEIMRKAKSIAMDLKIPVILVSQLNRKAERTSTNKPCLTDLQESVEQHSDIVLLLHRAPSEKADGYMVVAKHRNGKIGEIHFR